MAPSEQYIKELINKSKIIKTQRQTKSLPKHIKTENPDTMMLQRTARTTDKVRLTEGDREQDGGQGGQQGWGTGKRTKVNGQGKAKGARAGEGEGDGEQKRGGEKASQSKQKL